MTGSTSVFSEDGRIDRALIRDLIASGSITQLQAARAELVGKKQAIDSRISSLKEAGDSFAVSKAQNFARLLTSSIVEINTRLESMNAGRMLTAAVVIPGAGRSSALAASALNQFIARGAAIGAFGVVCGDLVIVAREPTT